MVIFNSYVKLPEGNIAIENGHRNSWFSMIFPSKMMIFHSYVNVHQRITNWRMRITWLLDWVMFWVDKGKGERGGFEYWEPILWILRYAYVLLSLSIFACSYTYSWKDTYVHTHIYIYTHSIFVCFFFFINAFAHTYISIYNIIWFILKE